MDCFEYMEQQVPDNSIDLCLTDPPYNIYQHKIETWVDMQKFFNVVYKKLKPDSWLAFCCQMPTMIDWCQWCQ